MIKSQLSPVYASPLNFSTEFSWICGRTFGRIQLDSKDHKQSNFRVIEWPTFSRQVGETEHADKILKIKVANDSEWKWFWASYRSIEVFWWYLPASGNV